MVYDVSISHCARGNSTYRFLDSFICIYLDIYTVFGDLHFISTHLIGHRFGTFIGHIFRSIGNITIVCFVDNTSIAHRSFLITCQNVIFLSTGNIVYLTASHDIGLCPSDSMIFRTIDGGIKSAVEVLRRLSCHGGFKLAIAFCSLAGHSRLHGRCRVHDILCFVCDGAIFRGVLDIRRSLLRLRGRARRIRDFRHGRILGIDLMILILPILVLNLEAILCRSDFRIGRVAGLVSHRAIDTFCGLLMVALIARCIIDKAYFVLFYIEGGRAGN